MRPSLQGLTSIIAEEAVILHGAGGVEQSPQVFGRAGQHRPFPDWFTCTRAWIRGNEPTDDSRYELPALVGHWHCYLMGCIQGGEHVCCS